MEALDRWEGPSVRLGLSRGVLASLQEFAIVTTADVTNASYGLSEWAAVPIVTSINAHISKGCGNRGLGMELRFLWLFPCLIITQHPFSGKTQVWVLPRCLLCGLGHVTQPSPSPW